MEWMGRNRKGLEWKEWKEWKEMVGNGRGRVGNGRGWKEWEKGGRHGDAAQEAFLELSHHRLN
jgi:hypothetical protein